jgi:hypothetical protein
MKILHLVLGCKNSHYSSIEKSALDTWVSNIPDNIKLVFMYGGKDRVYYDNDKSFYVDKKETIDLCLYKTICAFEFFLDYEFDFIFRSNITGYFDLNLVIEFLKDKQTKNFYCGCIGNLNGDYFASGSGYFISRNLVESIVENKNTLYNYGMPGWCDDVSVGKFITQELGLDINKSARRLDLNPDDISDKLDMSHYHYRILNKGDVNSIYRIHELKCKNQ